MLHYKRHDALPPPPKIKVAHALGVSSVKIDWLAGDGSDRCYYRVHSNELDKPFVLMQLSERDRENLQKHGYDWILVADIFSRFNIPHPSVRATLPEEACLIIEDYGNTMVESETLRLLGKSDFSAIEDLYQECSKFITKMLAIPYARSAIWCQRSFDREKYLWELDFFKDKYVDRVARLQLSDEEITQFDEDKKNLADFLEPFSTFFVHRDYHSRNLMIRGGDIALIDFQDARLGPNSYDLVSLVFDNYVPFEIDFRLKLFNQGRDLLCSANDAAFARAFDDQYKAIVLQRQLKAIGSYAYLTIDKKRGDYLRYIKPAIETLKKVGIKDDRWPFLSGSLIEIMHQATLSDD